MMLQLRDICKTYVQGRLDVPVLQGISLSVEEGEYLAIMGPSGSGKTTLMNIIGCLDNPTSGDYVLDGEDIGRISEKRMSDVRLHSIGFVFQSFYLLSRQSALDNVALPLLYAGVRRRERQQIARKALERVGLGDRTEFKPNQLSGGQCQRVAIARAIVNNPKIILADEPTGALDTKSGQQIMEIFQSLNDEGVTIVMITHEPEIAAHAKRTLHIRDGLLVDSSGKPLNPPPETLEPTVEPAKEESTPQDAGERAKKEDAPPADAGHDAASAGEPEDSGSKPQLPFNLDKRLESLKERLPELKKHMLDLLPKTRKQQEGEAASQEENDEKPPEETASGTKAPVKDSAPEKAEQDPAAPQDIPAQKPAAAPVASKKPRKEKGKPPKDQEQPSKATPESEQAISGETIIASLERQAGELNQNQGQGGEEPSNE